MSFASRIIANDVENFSTRIRNLLREMWSVFVKKIQESLMRLFNNIAYIAVLAALWFFVPSLLIVWCTENWQELKYLAGLLPDGKIADGVEYVVWMVDKAYAIIHTAFGSMRDPWDREHWEAAFLVLIPYFPPSVIFRWEFRFLVWLFTLVLVRWRKIIAGPKREACQPPIAASEAGTASSALPAPNRQLSSRRS